MFIGNIAINLLSSFSEAYRYDSLKNCRNSSQICFLRKTASRAFFADVSEGFDIARRIGVIFLIESALGQPHSFWQIHPNTDVLAFRDF